MKTLIGKYVYSSFFYLITVLGKKKLHFKNVQNPSMFVLDSWASVWLTTLFELSHWTPTIVSHLCLCRLVQFPFSSRYCVVFLYCCSSCFLVVVVPTVVFIVVPCCPCCSCWSCCSSFSCNSCCSCCSCSSCTWRYSCFVVIVVVVVGVVVLDAIAVVLGLFRLDP